MRTRPKSNSLAPNTGSMKTFSGFRSQWTSPLPCAISMTFRIASACRENSSRSIAPGSAPSRSDSTSARTNSITTYVDPLSSTPRSKTAGTWGTPIAASASASRSSASPAVALSARATLMATSCWSATRSARNTAPKPPCPSVFCTRSPASCGGGTTNGTVLSSLGGGAGGGGPCVGQTGAASRTRLPQVGQRIIGTRILSAVAA